MPESEQRPIEPDLSLHFPQLGRILFISTELRHKRHISAIEAAGFTARTEPNHRAVDHILKSDSIDLIVVAESRSQDLQRALRRLSRTHLSQSLVLALGKTLPKRVRLDPEIIVDHCLPWDITPLNFRRAVAALCTRVRHLREISPSTSLPGKTWVYKKLQDRISAGQGYALVFFDIDRFKSVSDVYGWDRSETFLQALSEALVRVRSEVGPPYPDLGHIGGDDFIALCEPDQILAFTRQVVAIFEHSVDLLYDPSDAKRGYILVPSRKGDLNKAALVTLSIGVIDSQRLLRPMQSVQEAAAAVAEMKRIAKTQPGSYVAVAAGYTFPQRPVPKRFV